MLESEIEKRLVYEVKQRGGLCLKRALEGLRGFPDRTVIWPETYADNPPFNNKYHHRLWPLVQFVELKKPGGKLSKQQEDWIETLEALGCDCFVIASMEDVDSYLEKL